MPVSRADRERRMRTQNETEARRRRVSLAQRRRMRTQNETEAQRRRERTQRLDQRRGLVSRPPNSNLSNNSNSNSNNKNGASNSNNRNKNVATWYNKEFTPVTKKNIKPKKRVYISTNVGNNGKIKTVFNKRGLKTFVRKVRDNFRKAMSPVTRRAISGKNIKPYTTKKKN